MLAKLYEWIFGAKAGSLWPHLFATLGSTFVGLVVAVASGFAVGMTFSQRRHLAQVLSPFIVALNSLPRIAFVPLITMIFGLGMASKVATAWFIVFFLVFFNTFKGALSIEREILEFCRTLGASERQITWTVRIPNALSWTFAALPNAVSFSLIGVVAFRVRRLDHRHGLPDHRRAVDAQLGRDVRRAHRAERGRRDFGDAVPRARAAPAALGPRIPRALITLKERTVKKAATARKTKVQATVGASTYVRPQEMAWAPTQFEKVYMKVLYQDKAKGELTCLVKLEPGAKLPMHVHPELEQAYVLEGSMWDHDGVCRAGEYVWRTAGSYAREPVR